MQEILFIVPNFMETMQAETQRACAQLQVRITDYVRSRIEALNGEPPTASALENLQHTIVGIKETHGNALAVRRYLETASQS